MHQIKRHTLTIDCSSSPFGKEVQLVVAELMEKEFYPKLEQLLDQYPMADATWLIDTIQVDIPTVSKKNWKNELVTKALIEIEAFLNKNYNVLTIGNKRNAIASNAMISNTQQAELLFIDYLKTGFFNRSSIYNTILDIEKQLAETTFKSEERKKAFCNELVKILLEYTSSLMRFIYTVSSQTKTSIRNEKIGFLFDVEAVLNNEKPDKKLFSSLQRYSNWISLLEWSLYLYKVQNSKAVIDRFAASSLVDFQINATEVNRFLDFLIHASKGKITKEQQDIIHVFAEEIKRYTAGEVNLKTETDTSSKPKKEENQTSLKNFGSGKNLQEEIEIANSLSEANDSVDDKSNNSLNSLNHEDKKEAKAANDTTAANSKKDHPELPQNVYTNPNSLHLSEEELQNNKISKDAAQFDTEFPNTPEAVGPQSKNRGDVQDKFGFSIAGDNQNDKEENKLAYRRFNLEEDTNAASTTSDETLKNSTWTTENPIYIENAGLIILHPFLIHLFEQLKLCKNEAWTSKRNHQKAVLITQYLITGSTVFFENDLVLNKIVCGLKADAVIDVSIKLLAKDIKEAKGLLEAVIGYWKPLNNSSIDSLRETFLQRNGKLIFKNETSIELWVERKGFDVLMAQIPWGIGMIKTPWMNHFIDCHWN